MHCLKDVLWLNTARNRLSLQRSSTSSLKRIRGQRKTKTCVQYYYTELINAFLEAIIKLV
jgi:hypothetical protein